MRVMSPEPSAGSFGSADRVVEDGRSSCEFREAKADGPSWVRHGRSGAMTEAQKRVGSLSNASRESQARACSASRRSASCALLPLACGMPDAAAQAESSVVFPLPAEAETSVKG